MAVRKTTTDVINVATSVNRSHNNRDSEHNNIHIVVYIVICYST